MQTIVPIRVSVAFAVACLALAACDRSAPANRENAAPPVDAAPVAATTTEPAPVPASAEPVAPVPRNEPINSLALEQCQRVNGPAACN